MGVKFVIVSPVKLVEAEATVFSCNPCEYTKDWKVNALTWISKVLGLKERINPVRLYTSKARP